MDMSNLFEVTFQENGVYQANLCEAPSRNEAERIFKSYSPEARVIDVSQATGDSLKPGKPILAADGKLYRYGSDGRRSLLANLNEKKRQIISPETTGQRTGQQTMD